MDNEEQKRRIPLDKKFMTKKINDILYGYLQVKSTLNTETNMRYIKKDDVNFTEIEEDLKYTFKRRTLVNHLSNLINYGFIGESEMIDTYGESIKVYTFPYNTDSIYKLIPIETLRYLVDTANPSVIAIYVYLLNKWEWKGNKYIFTEAELIKNCLGVTSTSNSRDYIRVNNVLTCLVNNGLIEYKKVYSKKDGVPVKKKKLLKVSTIYKGKRGDKK
jgi:hypothetical protein